MRVILHGSQKQNFDTWKGDDNLKIIIYNGNQIVLITKKKRLLKPFSTVLETFGAFLLAKVSTMNLASTTKTLFYGKMWNLFNHFMNFIHTYKIFCFKKYFYMKNYP